MCCALSRLGDLSGSMASPGCPRVNVRVDWSSDGQPSRWGTVGPGLKTTPQMGYSLWFFTVRRTEAVVFIDLQPRGNNFNKKFWLYVRGRIQELQRAKGTPKCLYRAWQPFRNKRIHIYADSRTTLAVLLHRKAKSNVRNRIWIKGHIINFENEVDDV